MGRLSWRPAALADLDAIYDYRAAESAERAFEVVSAIRFRCRLLADYPRAGRERDDVAAGLRMLPVSGQVVVAYRIAAEEVVIVRVFHGGQDWAAIMRDGKSDPA